MKFRQTDAEVEAARRARVEMVVRCILESFVVMISQEQRLLALRSTRKDTCDFIKVYAPATRTRITLISILPQIMSLIYVRNRRVSIASRLFDVDPKHLTAGLVLCNSTGKCF
jgi:hypothetical protein